MRYKHSLLSSFLLILIVPSALAQLSWDNLQIEFRPKFGIDKVAGQFRFENVGSRTIEIVDVQPACGCTTTALSKRTYGPGEAGVLAVEVTLAGLQGFVQRNIIVKTDAPEAPDIQLLLKLHIPVPATFSPSQLQWTGADKNAVKSFTVSIDPQLGLQVIDVDTTNDQFRAKLSRGESDGSYVVTVTAKDISQTAKGTVLIETNSKDPRFRVLKFPVTVLRG